MKSEEIIPPSTSWGHFHENMPEIWLDVWGSVCAQISGEGVVHGEYGDLINANEDPVFFLSRGVCAQEHQQQELRSTRSCNSSHREAMRLSRSTKSS